MARPLKDFIVKKVEGDGNCVFRAIADQVSGDENRHDHFRNRCVSHLRAHQSEFEGFITMFNPDQLPRNRPGRHVKVPDTSTMSLAEATSVMFDAYVRQMSILRVWGDEIELRALSDTMDICIEIRDTTGGVRSIYGEAKPKRCYVIYYGAHYNSLRPRSTKEPGYVGRSWRGVGGKGIPNNVPSKSLSEKLNEDDNSSDDKGPAWYEQLLEIFDGDLDSDPDENWMPSVENMPPLRRSASTNVSDEQIVNEDKEELDKHVSKSTTTKVPTTKTLEPRQSKKRSSEAENEKPAKAQKRSHEGSPSENKISSPSKVTMTKASKKSAVGKIVNATKKRSEMLGLVGNKTSINNAAIAPSSIMGEKNLKRRHDGESCSDYPTPKRTRTESQVRTVPPRSTDMSTKRRRDDEDDEFDQSSPKIQETGPETLSQESSHSSSYNQKKANKPRILNRNPLRPISRPGTIPNYFESIRLAREEEENRVNQARARGPEPQPKRVQEDEEDAVVAPIDMPQRLQILRAACVRLVKDVWHKGRHGELRDLHRDSVSQRDKAEKGMIPRIPGRQDEEDFVKFAPAPAPTPKWWDLTLTPVVDPPSPIIGEAAAPVTVEPNVEEFPPPPPKKLTRKITLKEYTARMKARKAQKEASSEKLETRAPQGDGVKVGNNTSKSAKTPESHASPSQALSRPSKDTANHFLSMLDDVLIANKTSNEAVVAQGEQHRQPVTDSTISAVEVEGTKTHQGSTTAFSNKHPKEGSLKT
jgi:OTU-like cysteine protease